MAKTKTFDPIPEFNSLDEIAEFWDAHSTADYDDLTHKVEFEVALESKKSPSYVIVLPELNTVLQTLAQARGVSVETLVNVWLTEKVLEQHSS